jgi:undecaprenyl-diphosphatase
VIVQVEEGCRVDLSIYFYMHEVAGRFGVFSYFSPNLILNPFIKNVPPVILFWALWVLPNKEVAATRQKLIASLFVAAMAICSARVISLTLPFKLRPMYDPVVSQNPIVNIDLSEWSAFPSDHATLFFSLAMCFLMINRFAGILAFFHATLIVSIPRILLGFHWPSDIIGGATLGIVVALILMSVIGRYFDRTRLYTVASRYNSILYMALIFLTMQIATMFGTMRLVASKLFVLFA